MANAPSGPSLTIREASRATGLSIKALRGRVERGSLRAVTDGTVRRIPLSELLRAGLLKTEHPGGRPRKSTVRAQRGTPSGYPDGWLDVLLERIESLGAQLAAVERALEGVRERASNVEADRERRLVLEARLDAALERIRELETARKRA